MKEMDVLKAIRWVKEAWNQVDEETIRKCFQKCGFIPEVCEEIESNDQIDTEFEELRSYGALTGMHHLPII